jgi:hypothetical protein
MFRSAFKQFKLKPGDNKDAIYNAYVRLVRRYPPEHFPEQFKKVQHAYNELTVSDQIIEKALQAFLRADNPFLMTALFCSDHLTINSTGFPLEQFVELTSSWKPSSQAKTIIAKIDHSKVSYRKGLI